MSVYVLLSGLVFMFLAYVWSSKGALDCLIKVILTVMTLYAIYLMIGPANMIKDLL